MLAINRNAIWNEVADLIEQNPAYYRFWETEVPDEGGSGCLWGLAGRMIGVPAGTDIEEVAPAMGYTQETLGIMADSDFVVDGETALYTAMTEAMTYEEMQASCKSRSSFVSWTSNAKFAAELLRRVFPVGVAA